MQGHNVVSLRFQNKIKKLLYTESIKLLYISLVSLCIYKII